jgi:hypothetical protein
MAAFYGIQAFETNVACWVLKGKRYCKGDWEEGGNKKWTDDFNNQKEVKGRRKELFFFSRTKV